MKYEISPKETEIITNWDNAKLYCFSLKVNNETGWRLPTIEELNEICESENDFENAWYWSSSNGNDSYASVQYFKDGIQENTSRGYKHSGCYARAVRSI